MRLVAESFGWPFRAPLSTWIWGLVTVLLLPLLFVPLLGYAMAATRAAEAEAAPAPPRWSISRRMLTDGLWTAAAVLASVAPFGVAWWGLSHVVSGVGLVAVFFLLALPWGILALAWLPHATARFAASGEARDLFDIAEAVRGVRRDFVTWNLAAAAIVTGWAIGIACAGLLCVGIVPGVFYAILVSAHAAAALHRQAPRPSPSAR